MAGFMSGMTDELKPCPFCGGSGQISPDGEVYCKDCGCFPEPFENDPIENWNTRHEPDTLPSWAIEAIEELKSELPMGIINHPHSYRETIRCCELVIEAVLSLRKPEGKE